MSRYMIQRQCLGSLGVMIELEWVRWGKLRNDVRWLKQVVATKPPGASTERVPATVAISTGTVAGPTGMLFRDWIATRQMA